MTRKLIHFDEGAYTAFTHKVAETADQCNDLITLFHDYQPWQRITTAEEFNELVRDPLRYFDNVIVDNIKLQAGGLSPIPEKLAELTGIDYAGYKNALLGLAVVQSDGDCEGCDKPIKFSKGKPVITSMTYRQYERFLVFRAGQFSTNDAVEQEQERFKTYADSPEAVEVVTHYEELISILNRHAEKFGLNYDEKNQLKKLFNLYLSRGDDGEFLTNSEHLKTLIISLKR